MSLRISQTSQSVLIHLHTASQLQGFITSNPFWYLQLESRLLEELFTFFKKLLKTTKKKQPRCRFRSTSQLQFTSLPLWRLCRVHSSFLLSTFQHYNIKLALISMFCVVLMFPRSHGILRGWCQLWSQVWTQVIHHQFYNIRSFLTEAQTNLFWTCVWKYLKTCTYCIYIVLFDSKIRCTSASLSILELPFWICWICEL